MTDSSGNTAPKADTNRDKTTLHPMDAMKIAIAKLPEDSKQRAFFTQLAKNTIHNNPDENDVAQAAVDYFARVSTLPPIELVDGKPTTKSVVQFLNLIRPEDRQAMQDISGMGMSRRGLLAAALLGGGALALGTAGGFLEEDAARSKSDSAERPSAAEKARREKTRDVANLALAGGAIATITGLISVIGEIRHANRALESNRDNIGTMVQNAEILITENEKLRTHINELRATVNQSATPGV